MNKKIIIIALLYACASIVRAELINDKENNRVSNLDLEVLLEIAPANPQKKLLKNKEKLTEQLEQLYIKKVLAQMAVAEGLDKEPMNAARLTAIMDNALFLLKLDALKKSSTKDYSKYAKQIYQVNKDDYPVKERIDAAHILIATKERSDAEALEKAKKIRLQLMQGANFTEVAVKESDDKSVKNNQGELGTFTRDQMVKPFSDTAFAMRVGELSEPVKTKFGYHIIKLNKKMSSGVKPYEEVKVAIIDKLKKADWEKDRAAFYQQVKDNNEMKIDELAVDEFVMKKLDELSAK